MSVTKKLQPGEPKQRTGSTPEAAAQTAVGNRARTGEAVAAAAKSRGTNGRFLKRTAAGQPGAARARSKVGDEEWSREIAAKLAGKTAQGEAGCEGDGDDAGKAATHGVKALTEAGKKRLVNLLLGLAETQAAEGGFKITPADLIRLMQLHKELNPQRDRKMTVQWIEDGTE